MIVPDTNQTKKECEGALHLAKRRLIEFERIIGENIHLFEELDQEELRIMLAGQKYFFEEFCTC